MRLYAVAVALVSLAFGACDAGAGGGAVTGYEDPTGWVVPSSQVDGHGVDTPTAYEVPPGAALSRLPVGDINWCFRPEEKAGQSPWQYAPDWVGQCCHVLVDDACEMVYCETVDGGWHAMSAQRGGDGSADTCECMDRLGGTSDQCEGHSTNFWWTN